MAKYSVNSTQSSRSEQERARGGSCELCGADADYLHSTKVAGANLEVCANCLPDDEKHSDIHSTSDNESNSDSQRNHGNRTPLSGKTLDPDSPLTEEELGYTNDPLPYLVDNYGDVVVEAREEKGLTQEELAESINVGVNIIRVIEQSQASDRDVGGTIVEQLETQLDIQIEEEQDDETSA